MGIVGPLFWGPFSDRLQLRFPGAGRAWTGLFCMGLSPLLSFWVYTAPDSASFYWRFVAYSLVLTGWMPPLYAIIYDQVLPRMRGAASAAYSLVAIVVASGIGPYWAGKVSVLTGSLNAGLLSILVLAIPAYVLIWLTARRLPHETPEARLALARAAGEPD